MKNKLSFAALAGLFVVLPLGLPAEGVTASFEELLLYCDVEALGKALEQGASANWVHPESGESALHYAVGCESGMEGAQYGLVQLLVGAGAVASAATFSGESVLERALLFGSEPTIGLLLASGADPHALTTVGVSMPALARIVGNASAERALGQHGAELADADLELVAKWGWIANFERDIEPQIDKIADLDGAEQAEALEGFLRAYFADHPEIVAELELDLFGREPLAYRKDALCCGPSPPAAYSVDRPNSQQGGEPLSVSSCEQNCHDGYRGCIAGCEGGLAGIFCRALRGSQRRGCLNRCKRQPQDPPES